MAPSPEQSVPAQGRPNRPPRIVLVDDCKFIHAVVDWSLRGMLPDYTLVGFRNRDEAWAELQRESPDLLITDMRNDNTPGCSECLGMNGGELLQLLARCRVRYPVIVASGSFSVSGWEAYAKMCSRPYLNVSFLTKPYSLELFQLAVRKSLGPSGVLRL
jgi:CheY-like chemotaxis protein